jgi:hypothetical protein
MRFTELERSLLSVADALVARLDLIEQGDQIAASIAERSCDVADLRREANRRETELIDEREDLRKELDRVRGQRDRLHDKFAGLVANPERTLIFSAIWLEREMDADKKAVEAEPKLPGVWGEVELAAHLTGQKAEPPEPKPLQLEVGKKYRTRDGEIVTVERKYDELAYPFYSNGGSYLADGIYLRGETCLFDLIEEVTEAESAEVAA